MLECTTCSLLTCAAAVHAAVCAMCAVPCAGRCPMSMLRHVDKIAMRVGAWLQSRMVVVSCMILAPRIAKQGWCEWHSSSRARPLDGDPSLVIADGSLNYRALLQHPSGIVGRCVHRFGALSSDHARCGGVSGDMCSLRRGGAVPRSVLPTRGARQRMHA